MKFRTDFVTNSSDSSFLTFNIKNKKLYDFLSNIGIKIEGTKDGEFHDGMTVTLPSGESAYIVTGEDWAHPYVEEYKSITAWLIGTMLNEVEDVFPPHELEDYSDFTKELIDILNKADVISLDWEAVQEWSREDVGDAAHEKLGAMDGDIEEAVIEHDYGFEGEVGPFEYVEVRGGNRMDIYLGEGEVEDDDDFDWDDDDEDDDEDGEAREGCEGMKFVITGDPKYFDSREEFVEYIEELGGTVTGSVSKKTHFVISNDLESQTTKMKKAKELCVPVITEEAFIRRFGESDDFDLEEVDTDNIWDITYSGGFYEVFQEMGIGNVSTQVWKKGKWEKK